MDLRSVLGYSKNSPWENAPYNLINTPQGLITMSNTNKQLKAFDANTGKFLANMIPGKDYKFPTNKVLEIPINKSGGWIAGAINPAHKGYCTPMTKSTCTPRRKAFAIRAKNHFQEMGGKYRDAYYQIGGMINDCPPGYVKDETGQCIEDNGYNPIQNQQKGAPIQSIINPLKPQPPVLFHPNEEFDNGLADDNPAKRAGAEAAGSYQQAPKKRKDPRPPFQNVVNTSQMAIGAVHAGLSIFGNYLEEARQKKWMQQQMANNFNATYSNAQNDYGVDPYEQTGQLRTYLKCGGKKKHQKGGKFNIYDYLYGDDEESGEDTPKAASTPKKQPKRITEDDIDELSALGLSPEDLVRETQDGTGSLFRPTSKKGFRSFATYAEGKKALLNQLDIYKTNKSRTGVKSNSTLLEAMSKYAPASDNNNPTSYANTIAKRLGISVNTPISNINTEQWANEIERVEGNKTGNNPGNLRPYKKGGVHDVDEQEIQRLINLGYKIERL